MSQNHRLIELCSLLRAKRPIPSRVLMDKLSVSRATLMRDFEVLRDRLNYPIIYDRAERGYTLGKRPLHLDIGRKFELPGLWISPEQAYAFLTVLNILKGIDPGFIEPYVREFRPLIKEILNHRNYQMLGLDNKIAVELDIGRTTPPHIFSIVATALLGGGAVRLLVERDGEAEWIEKAWPLRVLLTAKGWVVELRVDDADVKQRLHFGDITGASIVDSGAAR